MLPYNTDGHIQTDIVTRTDQHDNRQTEYLTYRDTDTHRRNKNIAHKT